MWANGRCSTVERTSRGAPSVTISGVDLDLRMESWLASDTIRRAGFGQVVANRTHVLIIERGVSVVALAPDGSRRLMTYASSLFAPLPRYRVVLR